MPDPSVLADFGALVLTALEEDLEWGSDTLDHIGHAAIDRGLATTDSETRQFIRLP